MPQWKVKKVKSTEPYRYLVILLEQNGNHEACGHERYQTKEQAIARASFLADNGQRCDVLVDVAASFGTGDDPHGKAMAEAYVARASEIEELMIKPLRSF